MFPCFFPKYNFVQYLSWRIWSKNHKKYLNYFQFYMIYYFDKENFKKARKYFQLTFKTTTLSQTDFDFENIDVRYINDNNTIVISNPTNKSVQNVEVYAVTGQRVYVNNISSSNDSVRYQVRNLHSGIYVVRVRTKNNRLFTQKIIAK